MRKVKQFLTPPAGVETKRSCDNTSHFEFPVCFVNRQNAQTTRKDEAERKKRQCRDRGDKGNVIPLHCYFHKVGLHGQR